MTTDKAIEELRYQKKMSCFGVNYQAPTEAIDMAISALEKQVVFCSECKYNNACFTQSFVESEGVLPFDRDTWFCADGERKVGADDAAD